jgi:hypothetical protein
MQFCKKLFACCTLLQQLFGSVYLWTDPRSREDKLLLHSFKAQIVWSLEKQSVFRDSKLQGIGTMKCIEDCILVARDATTSIMGQALTQAVQLAAKRHHASRNVPLGEGSMSEGDEDGSGDGSIGRGGQQRGGDGK